MARLATGADISSGGSTGPDRVTFGDAGWIVTEHVAAVRAALSATADKISA